MHDQNTTEWPKSGAPIAHVLNTDMSALDGAQSGYMNQGASAATFSGKLVDLLLDPADVPNKHRRADSQHEASLAVNENSVIQLPKPPQLPKQTAKRPRIPPLLQGLHQPPPLPPANRLFPPITDGVETYERDVRDRAEAEVLAEEKHSKGETETSPSTSKKQGASDDVPAEESAGSKKLQSRKRRKWSDDETKDLLVGVSRYGIGSWKRILQCEDFKFHGRTAVDLKDRFRVCCPGEGLKARKIPRKESSKSGHVMEDQASRTAAIVDVRTMTNGSSGHEDATTKKTKSINSLERSKLGIDAPFVRNPRRPRNTFSEQDDKNLWSGYEKHGLVWHQIRDDQQLDFTNRHPTDLRDRFRIRYPEAFAKAGFKPKPGSKRSNAGEARQDKQSRLPPPTVAYSINEVDDAHQSKKPLTETNTKGSEQDTSTIPSLTLKPPAPHHFSSWLDDMSHTSFADNNDGSESPIVLNRNILQWADSNTYPHTSRSGMHTSFHNDTMNDMSNHMTLPSDVFHIDPMATLKLPMMTYTHTTHTPPARCKPSTATTNPSPPHTTTHTTINTSDTLLVPAQTPTPSKSTSMQNQNANANTLLRTPNLPTIVFPHVPVASARNTLHNLPTPADLLSAVGEADVGGLENSLLAGFFGGSVGGGGWDR